MQLAKCPECGREVYTAWRSRVSLGSLAEPGDEREPELRIRLHANPPSWRVCSGTGRLALDILHTENDLP